MGRLSPSKGAPHERKRMPDEIRESSAKNISICCNHGYLQEGAGTEASQTEWLRDDDEAPASWNYKLLVCRKSF